MRGESCVSESDTPFGPPIALASLSGQSDAEWAKEGADYAGVAFLGGIAIDEPTREAAREMVERDRTEFLPPDPVAYIDDQLAELESAPIQPGFNVRTTSLGPLANVAEVCREHDTILEINAHCRQAEICGVGSGEVLLTETERLCEQVSTASERGVDVSVKVRAEVDGVDLPSLSTELETAGASFVHVDAMDSEHVVGEIAAATGMAVIANNGVRDRETVFEYLEYGADAVSVGRPSDDPRVLSRVLSATQDWFDGNPGELRNHCIGDNTEKAATQNHCERP
jgi:TIM-barrel protein